jgi:lipopolysaccharide/colanic/teichoic acid biosynthesis glycosyltransferase
MYKGFFKRIIDLFMSIIALPFWCVLLVIVGPIIYLEDRGPIFYNAPRLGKDGKIFKMYKFRSMKAKVPDIRNEDGSTFNSEDDPRQTKIGKFIRRTSIDETPQLLNVLKGDMSIVGPRPDLPEHRKLYVGNEARKLEIRPGVTGLNQAYYRNTIPWKDRIKNDLYYIDHLSIWLDIRILLKTAFFVMKCEAVFVDPNLGVKDGENINE